MAPHAESQKPSSLRSRHPSDNFLEDGTSCSTISGNFDGPPQNMRDNSSHLRPTAPDELHDLICVGFGPASLAIAVALHDALNNGKQAISLSALNGQQPRVAFLERQPEFAWHAGMILPGAKMQITFIKDLATLRDPRSEFTFLNYLHKKNRLVQFTNLGTFLPQRMEYEDYLRWCADWFKDVVMYSQNVFEIIPGNPTTNGEPVDFFIVRSKNLVNGETTERKARHVVIAVGGKPDIPKPLPMDHPRIIHSANYARVVPRLLPDTQKQYDIAIVGSGQSAAEVFHNLQKQYPNSRTRLLVRGSCLRPSDDSPFVNEIFDPERIDTFYSQPPSTRMHNLTQDRGTNYGVVRLELLENIYSDLYTQRLKYSREDEWPHRILNLSVVTSWKDLPDKQIALSIRRDPNYDDPNHDPPSDHVLLADVVIVAAGYRRDAHKDLLKPLRHLLPDTGQQYSVARDYKVKFRDGTIRNEAGIWLQGCNENSHGLSDTLLSVLATRGGDMVQSIFGRS